MRTKKRG